MTRKRILIICFAAVAALAIPWTPLPWTVPWALVSLPGGDTCRGGQAAPFTRDQLLREMRSVYYDMHVSPSCSNREASAQISNTYVQDTKVLRSDYRTTLAREGSVDCFLFDEGDGQSLQVESTDYPEMDIVIVRFRNVTCEMRTDHARKAEQVARLERTLNGLTASARRS